MYNQIRKNFKIFKPLNLQEIKIPTNEELILNKVGINPQSLRTDDQNNYIVEDQVQMLNTIGSYFETIHECKETISNNVVHQQV